MFASPSLSLSCSHHPVNPSVRVGAAQLLSTTISGYLYPLYEMKYIVVND